MQAMITHNIMFLMQSQGDRLQHCSVNVQQVHHISFIQFMSSFLSLQTYKTFKHIQIKQLI